MDYDVRSVRLTQIDAADQTFRITTNGDCADLVPSIDTIGLLQPPLLVSKGAAYAVVCGFRRIAAFQAMGHTRIPARVDHDHVPGMHHARMAIADNAFQRQLNVVEQSRSFAMIRRFAENQAEWCAVAASVGLPGSQAAMDRLLPISDMPASLQMAIVEGSVAAPVALSINELPHDEAMVVSDLLQRINTGLNNQRELLELIVDLSIIHGKSIVHLLDDQKIASILADDDCPLPQQVQHLRRVLKKMRYPELSKAEDAFHQAIKGLNVNSTIQIQPPRFFEGKTFRLALSIKSRQQLKSLISDIQKIADHPHILPE